MKLSPMQNKLYRLLMTREDVPIEKLYSAVYVNTEPKTMRQMQQRIGPFIARINEKLDTDHIRPGDVKRTYRLDVRKKAE